MEHQTYLVLLAKQFSGEISPAESATLDAWLSASEANRQLAASYRAAWVQVPSNEEFPFPVDLDADYAWLQKRIDAAVAQDLNKGQSRRPLKPTISWSSNWVRIAAAVTVLIAAVWGYRQMSPVETTTVSALEKQQTEVNLPDGSKVWLRKGAEITYSKNFSGKKREVSLRGEAYFDVQSNASRPFYVKTEAGSVVEVLGTQFLVKEDVEEVSVVVKTGKVRFDPGSKTLKPMIVKSAEKVVFNRQNQQIKTIELLSMNDLSWQTGSLQFVSTKISEMVEDLEDHYGVEITVQNKEILSCTYSSPLTNAGLDKILKDLAQTLQLTVDSSGDNHYILIGGTCR